MPTYLTPGDPNPDYCPHCKNPNYIYALTDSSVLNAQTGASVSGTVYHCENCGMNFASELED